MSKSAYLHTRHGDGNRAYIAGGRPSSSRTEAAEQPSPREPGPLARLANAWWTRLIESIYDGGLSAQEAEYESGETRRDYVWNTIGIGVWGMVFPVLTVVATELAGTEQAGRFSMAFAAGTLLMFLSNTACGRSKYLTSTRRTPSPLISSIAGSPRSSHS